MQKRISLIFLAGMCPQSLSDTGLSALEAKELPSVDEPAFLVGVG